MIVFITGCPSGGPGTVPVQGTLTIGGQPANNVIIGFVPAGETIPGASGKVENGSFKVFTGREGKPGAVPGKYKVVLTFIGAATTDIYKTDKSESSAAPKVTLPFPEKYQNAATSDKEVEITNGSNDLKIDIPAG